MGQPTYPVLNERRHDGGFIVSVANGHRSIDQVELTGIGAITTPLGVNGIEAGTVLGLASGLSFTAPQDGLGANGGNGVIGSVSITTPAAGVATIVLTSATAFTVTDATGATATGTVGTAFSGLGLAFMLTAGTDVFLAGDEFAVNVFAAGSTYTPVNPLATDGSQIASAILYGTKYMTSPVISASVVSRACEVNAAELIWPLTATPAQITAATVQLKSVGILAR